jgi:hypothetical protein
MLKTHGLLELCECSRVCEVGCVIDRRVAEAESKLEGLLKSCVDVD